MEIEYRDLSFGEDMRDVAVSCEKIDRVLGFRARRGVEDGILEIRDAIESGLIKDPSVREVPQPPVHRELKEPDVDLRDKRILVTGGSGFLGSHVVEALERRGCRELFVPRSRDYDLRREADVERVYDVVLSRRRDPPGGRRRAGSAPTGPPRPVLLRQPDDGRRS